MSELTHSESIVIARPPEDLYHMVSDVTRMGEWSPECRACWWDEGAGPSVGSWFTGRNEAAGRTWESRSEVVSADPGRAFQFVVGGNLVRWGYALVARGRRDAGDGVMGVPSGRHRHVQETVRRRRRRPDRESQPVLPFGDTGHLGGSQKGGRAEVAR